MLTTVNSRYFEAGDLKKLPDEEYDEPLGISTGAGAICATGGVMEAA